MGAENLHKLSRGGDKSLDKTDRMSVLSTVTSVWEMPGLDPAMPETSGLLPGHCRLDQIQVSECSKQDTDSSEELEMTQVFIKRGG